MCYGTTTTFACCGKQTITYIGDGKCELQEPYPAGHRVAGWKVRARICPDCQEEQDRAEARASRARDRLFRDIEQQKERQIAHDAQELRERLNTHRRALLTSFSPESSSSNRIEPSEDCQADIPPPEVNPTPMPFATFVGSTRGCIGIAMFPGRTTETLIEDVRNYMEYLQHPSYDFDPHFAQVFELHWYQIRASEQASFDFETQVCHIQTFRQFIDLPWSVANAPLVGEDVQEAAWNQLVIDYGANIGDFAAPERLQADWQLTRDVLATNDRRQLYGFERHDHHIDHNGNWILPTEPRQVVQSFREYIQSVRDAPNFHDLQRRAIQGDIPRRIAEDMLRLDLKEYCHLHLYPFGSDQQIVDFVNVRDQIYGRDFDFNPGSEAPTLLHFRDFFIVEASPDCNIDEIMGEYRERLREFSSDLAVLFNIAREAWVEESRSQLYVHSPETCADFILVLRGRRAEARELLRRSSSIDWFDFNQFRANPVISTLVPVVAYFQECIALEVRPQSYADIDQAIRMAESLIEEASGDPDASDFMDNHSVVSSIFEREGDGFEDGEIADGDGWDFVPESRGIFNPDRVGVPNQATRHSRVNHPSGTAFPPSLDQISWPQWPQCQEDDQVSPEALALSPSIDLLEQIQQQFLAHYMDLDSDDEEERERLQPLGQGHNQSPPRVWFEPGGPLSDVPNPH